MQRSGKRQGQHEAEPSHHAESSPEELLYSAGLAAAKVSVAGADTESGRQRRDCSRVSTAAAGSSVRSSAMQCFSFLFTSLCSPTIHYSNLNTFLLLCLGIYRSLTSNKKSPDHCQF